MKINSINNTNFKGLFIDMTVQNGVKWKMVYHPYSWEGGMVNKEKIDIKKLKENDYYTVDEKVKGVSLTEEGSKKIESYFHLKESYFIFFKK